MPPPPTSPHLSNSQSRTQEGVTCSLTYARPLLTFNWILAGGPQTEAKWKIRWLAGLWSLLEAAHSAGGGACALSQVTPSTLHRYLCSSNSHPIVHQDLSFLTLWMWQTQPDPSRLFVLNPLGHSWPVSCFRNTFLAPLPWLQIVSANPFQISVSHLTV